MTIGRLSVPKTVVVILAYDHVKDTLECIDSLTSVSFPPFEMVLVDNGSKDGTSRLVSERFGEVTVERIETNVGIARGYNRGVKRALERDPDLVMVINNDTLVDPHFLEEMLATFARHPEAGAVMPKIFHYYGEPNRLWSAGARWRTFPPSIKMMGAGQMDGPRYSREIEIPLAPSCCLLITAAVFREIGLFDPNYYFYFDDWDFCERLRATGKKIYFCPEAKVSHKVAVSTLKSDPPSKWWKVMGESTVRYFRKHKSLLALVAHVVWIMTREALKLKIGHVPAFAQGVISGLRKKPTSESGFDPASTADPLP